MSRQSEKKDVPFMRQEVSCLALGMVTSGIAGHETTCG